MIQYVINTNTLRPGTLYKYDILRAEEIQFVTMKTHSRFHMHRGSSLSSLDYHILSIIDAAMS